MAIFTSIKALLSLPSIIGGVKGAVKFLIVHWKETAIVAMIGTIFYQNTMETEWLKWVGLRTIPGIEQEVEVKEQQLHECELSREKLKGAIESTNDQIDKWANLSKDLQQTHDKFAEQLDKMTEERKEATERILNEPTPETCEAAIQYLQDSVEELRWQESE